MSVKIILNMIVKDEEHVMKRCIDSVLHLIDAVAIQDTGSTDRTMEVIRKYGDVIPTFIQQRPWYGDFSRSRNEALDFAMEMVKEMDFKSSQANQWYVMFMDADNTLHSMAEKLVNGSPEQLEKPLTKEQVSVFLSKSYPNIQEISRSLTLPEIGNILPPGVSLDPSTTVPQASTQPSSGDDNSGITSAILSSITLPGPLGIESLKGPVGVESTPTTSIRAVFNKNDLKDDTCHVSIGAGLYSYGYKWMIKLKDELKWRWFEELHEYIDCPQPKTLATIQGCFIRSGREGARNNDPQKYIKDAAMLLQGIIREPKNPRKYFYIAQSYKDAGEHDLAKIYYLKRSTMGSWQEEVYISFLEAAKITERKKGIEAAYKYYVKAHNSHPTRHEAVKWLIWYWRSKSMYQHAWSCFKDTPQIQENDKVHMLFFDRYCSSVGLLDELSLVAFYSGVRDIPSKLTRQALAFEYINDGDRQRLLENLKFYEK